MDGSIEYLGINHMTNLRGSGKKEKGAELSGKENEDCEDNKDCF